VTLVIDIATDTILGQYIDHQPGIRGVSAVPMVLLLDAAGYRTVPAWNVRIESV
jgi:hypothetical protein